MKGRGTLQTVFALVQDLYCKCCTEPGPLKVGARSTPDDKKIHIYDLKNMNNQIFILIILRCNYTLKINNTF